MLFFEEDTVGDGDRTAVEAVVSTNEELSKLLKEVETLQNSASAFSCEEEGDHDNDDDAGNKLELYKKWQFMGSYAAEAQGSKFLLGWVSQRIYKVFPLSHLVVVGRMRMSLARKIFEQQLFCCLMNTQSHLDLRAVLWLEYLCRWKKKSMGCLT